MNLEIPESAIERLVEELTGKINVTLSDPNFPTSAQFNYDEPSGNTARCILETEAPSWNPEKREICLNFSWSVQPR